MVKAEVVATGSTGNFSVIEDCVAIDVGVPYITVEPYMARLKLVLITHRHQDHFKVSTVRRMAVEKPMLRFGCGPFLAEKLVDAGVRKGQIDILHSGLLYNYGTCNVIPFYVYHDVPNYGYKLHFPVGKVFYATDLGNTDGLSAVGYDLIMLESNYREDELRSRMDAKIAAGQYAYEQRVMRYHLSERQCNDFIYRNAGPHTEYIYLHEHVERGSDESTDSEL